MTLGCSFLRLISDHYDDDDDDGEDDAHVHDSLMDAMLRIFYSNIGDNHHVQNLGVFFTHMPRNEREICEQTGRNFPSTLEVIKVLKKFSSFHICFHSMGWKTGRPLFLSKSISGQSDSDGSKRHSYTKKHPDTKRVARKKIVFSLFSAFTLQAKQLLVKNRSQKS